MKLFQKILTTGLAALAVMTLCVEKAEAASQQETRDYEAAVKDFKLNEWTRAEDTAAKFVARYTNSEYFAKVVLIEAQAQFKQKKCTAMVELLATWQNRAGSLGDRFAYWLGEGYNCGSDFHAAAEAFARLVKDYPASPLRSEAMFSEASARSRLQDWVHVNEALSKPDGAFQQMAKTNTVDEWIVRGLLLLSEAQAKQTNYAAAEATLKKISLLKANPLLEWQRLYLLCDTQLAAGHDDAARQTSVNLVSAAQNKPDLARSMELQGRILEELYLLPEAVKTYEGISQIEGMPAEQRREAFLQAVELTWRQNKDDAAEQMLNDYFNTHPELDEKGLETLTRGELRLKKYYRTKNAVTPVPGGTNNLTLAKAAFEEIINSTNSGYAGKAQLDLGWCLWEEKKYTESLAAFRNAVQHLPFSPDQAVARFKVGDVLYQLGDFSGAAGNYNAIIDQYGALAAVKNDLFERALYQLVRTGLGQTNLDMATGALKRILEWFPDGLMAQSSMLLVGQGLSSEGGTRDARNVFQDFASRFPQSPLLPEVKLAIARTYEAEKDWPRAIAELDGWVGMYMNSPTLPRAEFARAQVNYEAGRETNAFMLLTNFITRFPSNELALKAQYWVGDYYWRQPDYASAEAQYQEVYKNKNWPESNLKYEALMMAGRAAMMRENYGEAIGYFTNHLFKITNCPLDLRLQALFAAGDAKMSSAVTATATNYSSYTEAIENYYKPITADEYSTNRIASLAWGRIGDCYFFLATGGAAQFTNAIDAYRHVMDSPRAGISARSMAECGLAKSLAGMARLKPIGTQREAFMEAVGHFLNVAEGKNLRDNEVADPYWIKEAGKAAGALDEDPLGDWDKARALYDYLAEAMPSWKSYWDKRIEAVNARREKQTAEKPPEKN